MKTKSFFFWGTVCCCLFCFLQIWYPFYFYYVEQLQVFPLTWALRKHADNLAGWLAGWVVSFCNSIIFLWVVRWFRPVCFWGSVC